ncbi:MAG: amidohydrolase family protein [Bryobacteraceae bacterium]
MQGKIILEEHFAQPDTIDDSERYFPAALWPDFRHRLVDIHGTRLEQMDKHGIELCILSLNAPAIQAVWDRQRAIELARQSNDYIAEQVAKNPKRFHAVAALPMQDPEEAAKELTRCVKELGFLGALVNGFTQVDVEDSSVFYDLPQYGSFWATVEQLGVPFYLHPRLPLPTRAHHFEGHPWLYGPAWAFAAETSVHALRLMASGLFDKHPNLTIILGHLGENIPAHIWRTDHRIKKMPLGIPAKKPLAEYLRNNFYVTTSGNFRDQTLTEVISEIGVDRVLFSADWPFEEISQAAEWFDHCAISESDRQKIGRENARTLFGL